MPTNFTFIQWESPETSFAKKRRGLVQINDEDIEIAVIIEISKGAAAARMNLLYAGARNSQRFLKLSFAQILEDDALSLHGHPGTFVPTRASWRSDFRTADE